MLYFRNIVGGGWETGHLWSLSLEEQFYFLWPAALVLVRKRRGLLIGVVMAGLTAWRFVDQPASWALFVRPDLRLDPFLMGACLALWFDSLPLNKIPIECVALAVVPWTVLAPLYRATGPVAMLGNALLLVIFLKWTLVHQLSAFARFLSPLRYLGTISYSLYLWQQLFLGPHLHWWSWPVLVVCATASYYLIEKSFLYWKDLLDGAFDRFSLKIPEYRLTTPPVPAPPLAVLRESTSGDP